MEEDEVIPDVIDQPPETLAIVIYPNNKEVILGHELTPTDVIQPPEINWDAKNSTYYTLAMVDPDAPSRIEPTYREIIHWLVINIVENDLSTGEEIFEYVGSRPPLGTGYHRYVQLIYKQEEKFEIEEGVTTDRRNFSIRKFAEQYNLGQPFAGNFYVARWDCSVGTKSKNITY